MAVTDEAGKFAQLILAQRHTVQRTDHDEIVANPVHLDKN
jgi:hypothetical protein